MTNERCQYPASITWLSILAATVLIVTWAVPLLSGCVYADHNFRTVVKKDAYRSGQIPANRLGRILRGHDIKTVVSLRGVTPEEEWWAEEKAVCKSLGVEHYDLEWTKQRLPEPDSLKRFVEIIDERKGPVLVHCQGGTHRSGVAAACIVLLDGGTVEEARKQFGLGFGDAPIGRLLDLYEGSEVPFGEWVARDYPALYKAEMEE